MSTNQRRWIFVAVAGLIVFAMGCELSGAAATATPTAADTKGTPAPVVTPQAKGSNATPTQIAEVLTVTAQVAAVETLVSSAGLPTGTAQSAMAATLLASIQTPTPGVQTGGGTGGTGGTGGSGGSSSGGGSGGSGGSNGGSNGGSSSGGSTPEPTLADILPPGPYVVKQIETLGGEVISGAVCSTSKPFVVNAVTSQVAFAFVFAPLDAQHGKVSYQYSIPKAGESHSAAGTYTISSLGKDGTLQVSLVVSDHVVFKGFDGNIPNRYKFNLVPSDSTGCKPAQ